MQVMATTASSNGQSSASALSQQEISPDKFLTLLITQLQNQDPLNPMDQQQFMGELAQIQSVSELRQISETVGQIREKMG